MAYQYHAPKTEALRLIDKVFDSLDWYPGDLNQFRIARKVRSLSLKPVIFSHIFLHTTNSTQRIAEYL